MTFESFDSAWWPYLFILLAGSLPTAVWRWVGVWLVGDLNENSEWVLLVRCISTALVAAVVAQFIFHPTGAFADIAMPVRIAALAFGFLAFLKSHNLFLAIVLAEGLLFIGAFAL